jgi:hypothetical protein
MRFEFESGTVSFYFSFIFVSFRESCLFVSWCVGGRCGRIVAGVGDLVQRTGDGRTGQVLSGRAIKRLDSVMCGLHRALEDEEREFLGWP